MYQLDKNSQEPLHIQLYKALKEDISTRLKVGEKLPSIRKLASLYNISKTTVESAYSQLYAEGLIESRPKSGYYVADLLYSDTRKASTSLHHTQEKKEYKYDFFPAQLKAEDFPLKTWKRCSNKALNSALDFGSYGDGQGEYGLREEISAYLRSLRGVKCSSTQVVICSGFSDSMGIIAKLLKDKFSTLGMEAPGYHVARSVFYEYGYKIESIQVDGDGVKIEEFKKSKAQLIYTTPAHHYPTGVTIPLPKRLKILHHIESIKGFIIEDDYDSELAYDNRPLPSLQGLDTHDRVIYLGTFAKSLSPALRVSYMILPLQLLKLYKQRYDAYFPRVSLSTQKTLEIFMAEGHWERHLRKIRTINKKKHTLLKKLLNEKLGSTFKIEAQGAGLAILINPSVAFDMEKLKTLAEQRSMKLYFAKERSGGEFEALRMGFGGFNEKELKEAIDVFSTLWHSAIL